MSARCVAAAPVAGFAATFSAGAVCAKMGATKATERSRVFTIFGPFLKLARSYHSGRSVRHRHPACGSGPIRLHSKVYAPYVRSLGGPRLFAKTLTQRTARVSRRKVHDTDRMALRDVP